MMNAALFSEQSSAPDINSLVVSSSGQEWKLTTCFEPIWRMDGRLEALEILSRPACGETGMPVKADIFFEQASLSVLLEVFRWQLAALKQIYAWCVCRGITVSLNITRALAKCLLNEPALQNTIRALAPRVRLEISEYFFPDGADPQRDWLLPVLRELAPLWLDDYGAGNTACSWLVSGVFEFVKVDRHFIQALVKHPEGGRVLKKICTLSAEAGGRVIAEGVCSEALHAFACNNGVAACQGWLWPGVTAERLGTLPTRLSVPE